MYTTHQVTPLAGSHDENEELLLMKYSAIYWTKTRISCVPVLVDFLIRTLVNLVIQNKLDRCLLLPRYCLHIKTLNKHLDWGLLILSILLVGLDKQSRLRFVNSWCNLFLFSYSLVPCLLPVEVVAELKKWGTLLQSHTCSKILLLHPL